MEVVEDPATEAPRAAAPAGAQSCTLATSAWTPLQTDELGSPLRATGMTAPFAHVLGGSARIKLTGSMASDAIPVTVSHGGVELRGVMMARHVPLHPRRPIIFEGFAIPKAAAQLRWRGGGPAGIQVSYTLSGGLEADKLQASVPCGDLTLDQTYFDATAKLLAPTRGRFARLRFSEKSPLATTAGSAAVAWIDPDNQPGDRFFADQVRELHFDGSHSHIVWDRLGDVVFGWVPADAIYVAEADERVVLLDEEGTVGSWPTGVAGDSPSGYRRCREALPLFASVADGPPIPVGTLRAGVAFDVMESEAPMSSLLVPDVLDTSGPFIISGDARILTHQRALASCSEIP